MICVLYFKAKWEADQEKIAKAQEELRNNSNLKEEMKKAFVGELMRRQECNGTFEPTEGTVLPFKKYTADDPVAKWFASEREVQDDIVGEKWDSQWDAEYLRKGMKGWG